MTNHIKYQGQQIPSYSGITINIANPTMNANTPPCVYSNTGCQQYNQAGLSNQTQSQQYTNANLNGVTNSVQALPTVEGQANIYRKQQNLMDNYTLQQANQQQVNTPPQVYPSEYYLNNYNSQVPAVNNYQGIVDTNNNTTNSIISNKMSAQKGGHSDDVQVQYGDNMDTSTKIIGDLDKKVAEQKELENNGKQKRVVALTNEYIMSLENYLNNPNKEIRLMAAKEILTRLDEDKNRYDDAALNALLNKMLQDPEKLVRIAAMSAFSSQLASGNDFTVELLNRIQQNPNADKEDVVEAANILLKMSATTEVKYVPTKVKESKSNSDKELEKQQKKIEQLQGQLQKYKEKEIGRILEQQNK